MSVDTVFYIVGLIVTAGALLITFAGLRMKEFPSRGALGGILAVFAALVIATCGLAVAVAREEQDHRRQEQAEAAKLTEESETPSESSEQSEQAATGGEETGATGGGEAAEGAGGTLELAADESALAYDKTELESAPGEVTINFDNPSPIPHDVVIRGEGGEDIAGTDVITQDKATVVAELPVGEYQFYCSVPGHEQAGMVGTLTVQE